MKKHANIPIFIPHLGCPNQCVFCNQRSISGRSHFDPEMVIPTIEAALSTIGNDRDTEIAFFGGSFTGIDRDLMIRLLEIAHKYVECGKVASIRCSTRPDYIDEEILEILSRYGVKVIELGLQSTSDAVLDSCKRGHTFQDERRACKMIVSHGFELVGQMMIGLPGSTIADELETADFIISAGAMGARIYPTVVFHGTELCQQAIDKRYTPLSVSDAIERASAVLHRFIDAGVDVIRIGLCASNNLSDKEQYYAGPNHPALGELIESRVYFDNIVSALSPEYENKKITVFVPVGALSKAIGQKRENKSRLIEEFRLASLKFRESDALMEYEIKIELEGETKCT